MIRINIKCFAYFVLFVTIENAVIATQGLFHPAYHSIVTLSFGIDFTCSTSMVMWQICASCGKKFPFNCPMEFYLNISAKLRGIYDSHNTIIKSFFCFKTSFWHSAWDMCWSDILPGWEVAHEVKRYQAFFLCSVPYHGNTISHKEKTYKRSVLTDEYFPKLSYMYIHGY